MNEKYVLITTEHRGVFAGKLESSEGNKVVLTDARCAIRWSTTSGFLELASKGPNSNSKIGAKAPRIELFGITSIADLSSEAITAWGAATND